MDDSKPVTNASPSVGITDDSPYNRGRRISKEDAFMVLAIWMELSPLAKIVEERAQNDVEEKAKNVEKKAKNVEEKAENKSGAVQAKATQTEIMKVLEKETQTERAVLPQTENNVGAVLEQETQTEIIKRLEKETQTEQVLPQRENKVGAVLVTEENRLYAVDCTRDGVHAMARLLMKHSQKLKNSTIYTSRRPCSFCAKLLVQCGVNQLYYLPTEPEITDVKDLPRVENLLKVARLAHSYFVPEVDEKVMQKTKVKVEKKSTSNTPKLTDELEADLVSMYLNEDWIKTAAEELRWTAYDDEGMLDKIMGDFKTLMRWISEVTVIAYREAAILGFVKYPRSSNAEALDADEELCHHLLAMAEILAERTDDPKTGVGAVIWKESEKQIVATGWNGFPAKALYGEFPRTADAEEKKYPFVIHAEQNALLMRNTADVSESILFVTKIPCNECVPLLKLENVNKYVVGIKEQKAVETETQAKIKATETPQKDDGKLKYDKFFTEVMKEGEGKFICFVMKEEKPPAKLGSGASMKLDL